MPILFFLSGVSLGGAGAALLRGAQRGDRRFALAGWLAIAAMLACFAFAMGAETGIPTALAALSVVALAFVWSSRTSRAWRAKDRTPSDEIAPARRESAWLATSRWLAAGPIALVSATLSMAGLALFLGGENEDTLIVTMTAIVLVWCALAAWAFSTRTPLRTLSLIAALGMLGGATIAAGMLT
jgi:small-conductance mechanosensitive channel